MAMGDIVNIFEGTPGSYANFSPAPWTSKWPASRFSNLIYGASVGSLGTVLGQSASRHAGYVYITDDVLSNPWDSLPSYWNTEVSSIRQTCSSSAA
jgi:hypothetical protein